MGKKYLNSTNKVSWNPTHAARTALGIRSLRLWEADGQVPAGRTRHSLWPRNAIFTQVFSYFLECGTVPFLELT